MTSDDSSNTVQIIPIETLVLSAENQPRETIDEAFVQRLAADLSQGEDEHVLDSEGKALEPVRAVLVGDDIMLADGFHRVRAARAAGIERIQSIVTVGTERDVVELSVRANHDTPRKRTNADKRRNIERALLFDEWRLWSDARVGKMCGVSTPTVGKIRGQLEASGVIQPEDMRRGADGRLYPRASSQRSVAGNASARVRRQRATSRGRRRGSRDILASAPRVHSLDALLGEEREVLLDALVVEDAGTYWDTILEHLGTILDDEGFVITPNTPALPAIMARLANSPLAYKGCFFAKSDASTHHVWSANDELEPPTHGKRLADLIRALSYSKKPRVLILSLSEPPRE